jgi:hypothetical protein
MYQVKKGTTGQLFKDAPNQKISPYQTTKDFRVPVSPDMADTLVLLPGSPFWNVNYPQSGFTNHYAFKQGQYVLVVKPEDVEFLFAQF